MTFWLIPHLNESGDETGYYTREPDGVSGMTVTALAEFNGTKQPVITSLLNRIEQSDPISNQLSDCLKPFAGQNLRLISNDLQGRLIIPDEVCHAVTEYYAFEARDYDGKEVAVKNYRIVGKAGMRVFIWSKTGFMPLTYRQQQTPLQHTTIYIKRLENMRDHQVDDSLWTTFREGAEVLLLVEKDLRVPVDQLDLCDGSIGNHWSQFRVGQSWTRPAGNYIHIFRDRRGPREARAYHYEELPHFKTWLRTCYVPIHLPQYLTDKHGKRAVRQIYSECSILTDHIFKITEEKRPSRKQDELYQQFLDARMALAKWSA